MLRADAYTTRGVLLFRAGKTIESEQQLLRLSQPDVVFFKRVPRVGVIDSIGRESIEAAALRVEASAPKLASEAASRGDGKTKDEISLCARLTCLADVFDAITTDRPYH